MLTVWRVTIFIVFSLASYWILMERQPESTHWSDLTWFAIFGIRLQLRHPTRWSSCLGLTARRQGTRH